MTKARLLKLCIVLMACAPAGCGENTKKTPTFARDIAPITYQNCVPCHRPGEAAPFDLITYDDVAGHATQVAEVTRSRYMPPWLPDAGHHRMLGERRLSEEQIAKIAAWVEAGKPEGNSADLPALSEFSKGWQLGEPDLVIRMPRPYELPADGVDVYRNFVIPIPVDRPRWVRGMELRPDNHGIVHHAFMLINRNGQSRRLDEEDDVPGFDGMDAVGAESPDGHFISWQPGKVATFAPEGMAWLLTPGTDLVLQMHMQPTGKPERVQASVGFFFTDEPPTRHPVKLVLRSTEIDIPAGEANYEMQTKYSLPVDVDLIGIIPHAHYLGKRLEALAIRPDGTSDILLRISDWDFNWQGDYRYAEPIHLPRGTTLVQRFSYDNSTANVRNPNSPPKRVTYGLQSVDEMGELWLQVLPKTKSDRQLLLHDFARHTLEEIARRSRRALSSNPDDVKSLVDLGKSTLVLQSPADALPLFRRAVAADPQSLDAQYYLGHALLVKGDLRAALDQLDKVRHMDAKYQLAWHDLGLVFMRVNRLDVSEQCFRKSLELDTYHGTTLSNLGLVLLKQNKIPQGITMLERALQVRPTDQRLIDLLHQARAVEQKRP